MVVSIYKIQTLALSQILHVLRLPEHWRINKEFQHECGCELHTQVQGLCI
jgi:hypothetical protein